ncbi:dihydrofolate reductase [Phlebotomus argentipes]|uniref:dihydrofolate reductase n=1 Tax=Phlebotomus argentipes TaxID=94469 RepID=UPI00289359E3|nr:dihydrofolate reductase [Phlebotomus argentipes]
MSNIKLNLCVAACENLGIGLNGNLPWHLKQELKHFNRVTTKVSDPDKKNAAIMGRKTYFGIPEKKRPLPGRLNIVLSRQEGLQLPSDVIICSSLPEALKLLGKEQYRQEIENVWIVGGYSVYKEAMESENCHRIYFTDVKKKFECDAFFPVIPEGFKIVPNDEDIPSEVQEENGIQYQYLLYEKTQK